jgi:hypothetical protein
VRNSSPGDFSLQCAGNKTHFLATDIETRPALLPVMASGGDRGKHPWGGDPSHDGHQPSSHRARIDPAPRRASSSAR